MQRFDVRTGKMAIASAPAELQSIGIGSCVVIILRDPVKKVAAMAHAMLPGEPKEAATNLIRYTSPAIDRLIQTLEEAGANKSYLEATLVGGAKMFRSLSGNLQSVGERNVEATKEKLKSLGIKIVHDETGGTEGRHVTFDVATGKYEL